MREMAAALAWMRCRFFAFPSAPEKDFFNSILTVGNNDHASCFRVPEESFELKFE